MRVLTKLSARADAAYDNAHHAKLRGRLWGALDGTDYDARHDTDEPPGFCFSLVFPPRDMEEGDERWLLVASPDEELLAHVARDLQGDRELNVGEMPFHVEQVHGLAPDVGEPGTRGTLESVRADDGTLSETDVARDAVEKYYQRLHDEKGVGKQTYADYVDSARADELGRLSLIDQRRAADVFVCRTDVERNLAERLRDANHTYDFETLRRLLDETKPYRVSVPYYREDSETADAIRSLPKLIEDEGLYQLDVRQYESYFDDAIGFVVPENTVEHLFL